MALFQKALVQGAVYFALASGCSTPEYIPGCGRSNHYCYRQPHPSCVARHTDFDSSIKKNLKKDIDECKEEELYCVAAKLEEKKGNYKGAVENYIKANDFESAGDLENKHGDPKRAKEYYEAALKFYDLKCAVCASRVAENIGDAKRISEAKKNLMLQYGKWNMPDRAAGLAEDLNLIDLAIGYNERAGYLAQAAELCKKRGDKKRALGIYKKTSWSEKEVVGLELEIAQDAEKKGDYAEAIKYYGMAGDSGFKDGFRNIIRVAQKLDDLETEIVASQRLGEYEANEKELVTKAKEKIVILGELGELRKAARLWHLIGNIERASLLNEYADYIERARFLYTDQLDEKEKEKK